MSTLRLSLYAIVILAGAVAVISFLAINETYRRLEALDSAHSLSSTRHGQIEYLSWGNGQPVLVVHGAGGGFDQGRLLAETFGGSGFRFIAVSRFGYLGSILPEDPSTKAQAEAFADLIDTLGIERISVLAMSGGVPPALKFAELFPAQTERMVLLSSAPFTPFEPDVEDRPIPTWLYAVLLSNDVFYWVVSKTARRQLEAAFDAREDLKRNLPEAEEVFVNNLVDTFLPASRRLPGVRNESAAVNSDATYGLGSIEAPLLIVHARDDRLNPFAIGEMLATKTPVNRFLVLDSGGHLLLGHHRQLRSEIERFLAN